MKWDSGTQIIQYETWRGEIGTARPVTVVHCTPETIAAYTHPHVTFVTRGIENRQSLSLSERIDLYTRGIDSSVDDFRTVISPDLHVLALYDADSWHPVLLFWSIDWQFKFWYVNLQTPLRRLHRGFASQDMVLDIVVQPDMTWDWKDCDEFEALIAKPFFSREEEYAVKDASDRMVAAIENRGAPFCDGWEDWRPDENWLVPCLTDDWNAIE